MEKLEVTSMSSRGQVVIPLDIRQNMNLKEGEKFMVIGLNDAIILKKIERPSLDSFKKMIEKSHKFAKENKIAKKDLELAIQKARE